MKNRFTAVHDSSREEIPALSASSICAVIVSYHPTSEMIENIPEVLRQVDSVVVIDNGSTADEMLALRRAKERLGFHLVENGDNFGIASALNQGAHWAKKEGYPWVIFFDQDSKITDGFIKHMAAAWENHPDRSKVCSIHPKYIDPATGVEPRVRRARDGGPIVSMTSGALMPTWIFEKIGGFASEYFIDCVDFEYCFRIRAAGYTITDSRTAVLLHTAGHPTGSRTLLGSNFRPTHHSSERRYYISRNRVALYRKYFFVFPAWVVQSMYDAVRETIKCFVGETNRTEKFWNFLLGTWHGAIGKMGKREAGSNSH